MLRPRPVPANGLERTMSQLPTGPLRVSIFGAGRVATAAATLLQERAHRIVAVASPRAESAERSAARLGAPVAPAAELAGSDAILIGAPDGALSDAVVQLGDATKGAVLIHFAGSAGIAPLHRAADAAALCALHPVQACPDVDTAIERLPGSAWGVTCSDGARDWAHALIRDDLRGLPVDVAEDDRVLWHAAAVTTSNGISALMATGESLLSAMGIDAPDHVLGPIAAGTVANARDMASGTKALTGPVVRGEVDVISRHVDAVDSRAAGLGRAYRDAVLSIVSSARATGRISEEVAADIRRVLQ